MKTSTLILITLGACAPVPHRVCSIAVIADKGSSCASIGRNIGPQMSDVGIWRQASGGIKWCVSTLDPAHPVMCTVLVPSPAEQAADMAAAAMKAVQPTAKDPPATKEAPKP